MIEIILSAQSTEEILVQIQESLGGEINERWGEHTLAIDNDLAKGCIRCITFDWGVSLIEFDVQFDKDVLLVSTNKKYNPLHFCYCSKGCFMHRFEEQSDYFPINQYHSSINIAQKNSRHYTLLPKQTHIIFNDIRIIRKEFRKKRNNQLSELNENLYRIFSKKHIERNFAYYSPIHLKMEDNVSSLRNLNTKGITRVLEIEGEVYHLLAMHISRHDRFQRNEAIPHSLLKEDLKIIRQHAKKILDEPSLNYNLDQISKDSGLSQAKLQEGFKFLYTRTVTEYIRHIRLEAARDLMNTTDLNISQIVYTIGFTSRSYFSKIFKEKYGMTPHEFRKQVIIVMDDVEG